MNIPTIVFSALNTFNICQSRRSLQLEVGLMPCAVNHDHAVLMLALA